MSGLGQELGAEQKRCAELQRALEQSQQDRNSLQEDYYGKESEVSALRQDLTVPRHIQSVFIQFHM